MDFEEDGSMKGAIVDLADHNIRHLARKQDKLPHSSSHGAGHRRPQRSDQSSDYVPSGRPSHMPSMRGHGSDLSQSYRDDLDANRERRERLRQQLLYRDLESRQMDEEAKAARTRTMGGGVPVSPTHGSIRPPPNQYDAVPLLPPPTSRGHGSVTSVDSSREPSQSGYGPADDNAPRGGSYFGGHGGPARSFTGSASISDPYDNRVSGPTKNAFDDSVRSNQGGPSRDWPSRSAPHLPPIRHMSRR
jgi:hypothetical protein